MTRLVSVMLMVVVSVGLTAGIFMSTDKITDSLAEYHDSHRVSDIMLMQSNGTFTEEDIEKLNDAFGAENVLTCGLLELDVKDGKATVNQNEVKITGVPDGIIRIYIFDCDSPSAVTQNTLTVEQSYDVPEDSDAITVYAERQTEQLAGFDSLQTFSLDATITTTVPVEEDVPMLGHISAQAEATLDITQKYVLGGTIVNPLHMAIKDDPSFTDDPASDNEEDTLDLTAIFYVFGNIIDTTADGTAKGVYEGEVGGRPVSYPFEIPVTDEHVPIGAAELLNEVCIDIASPSSLFSLGYEADLDAATQIIDGLGLSSGTETLTLHENFSFESFKEYGNKIIAMGIVLIVVFMFVTVLVVLSTMTRLLDEERGQIACLMTLGYRPFAIISKYLLFAAIGTLIGGFAAYFAGLGLAWIIYMNFEWNYLLPPYSLNVAMTGYIIIFAVIFVATLAATAIAGFRMTAKPPAELLRPKSPKDGKTVFLERIPLIWNKLSFKYKSTMRKVLRFFMRFIMTVVSVALSTALVLAGLAVLDCCLFQDIGGAAMIGVAVIVLVFAALLNFVVIYTLTNINISERERELATLMVLGYYDGEVAGYIFREIYITSAIGIIFGLPLGALLCLLIFGVMGFGSLGAISWFVWILTIVLSVVFSILVTLMLWRKIVKIDMNHSLKAIE